MVLGNMKSEFKSKIEVDSKTGRILLIVYYDSVRDDFDKAINRAIAFRNIRRGEMNVVALPDNLNSIINIIEI